MKKYLDLTTAVSKLLKYKYTWPHCKKKKGWFDFKQMGQKDYFLTHSDNTMARNVTQQVCYECHYQGKSNPHLLSSGYIACMVR